MTDDDKQLLLWAARAAGIEIEFWSCFDAFKTTEGLWNSLVDDGDCARMEAALEATVTIAKTRVSVEIGAHSCTELYADHSSDRNKARRYASTRAAAEIGKAMSESL